MSQIPPDRPSATDGLEPAGPERWPKLEAPVPGAGPRPSNASPPPPKPRSFGVFGYLAAAVSVLVMGWRISGFVGHIQRSMHGVATAPVVVASAAGPSPPSAPKDGTMPGVHAALSADGTRVVTAIKEIVVLYNARDGRVLRQYKGHTGPVMCLAFFPDGRHLLSGSQDGSARIFDSAGGPESLILSGHPGGVSAIAVDPQGRYAFTAGKDHTVQVWTSHGAFLKRLSGHSEPVTSLAASSRYLVSGGGSALLWDVRRRKLVCTLAPPAEHVRRVAISRDSKLVATAGENGVVRIRTISGHLVRSFKEDTARGFAALLLSPDGSSLTAAWTHGETAEVSDWATATGLPHFSFSLHNTPLDTLDVGPNGRFLISNPLRSQTYFNSMP